MDSNTETVPIEPTLTDFFGTGESPIIVSEQQLATDGASTEGILRSLPLFWEFELAATVYGTHWHRPVDLIDHEYFPPKQVVPESAPFPLVHLVTSDQLEAQSDEETAAKTDSQADLTWELFRAATESERYILITDTDAPQIPSRTPTPGRSAADQFNAITFEYDQLVHQYVAEYVNSTLPLSHTRNVYFHRLSEYHAGQNVPAATLADLFAYDMAPPESPVWDPLYRFIEHQDSTDDEIERPTIEATIEPWVEASGIEPIANQMMTTLQHCSFDRGTLQDYQHDSER